MNVLRLLLLVLGLSHVRGCFTPLCDAAGSYEPRVLVTRTADQLLIDAIKAPGGELVVETAMSYLPPEYHHTVVRMDAAYGPQAVATFDLEHYFGSGLVSTGESWWYSIAGGRSPEERGVFFLTPEETFVPVDGIHGTEWIPLAGGEPGGLFVGGRRAEPVAIEVTEGGVQREWPMPNLTPFSAGFHDAERLANGAIALVSFQPRTGLELQILDGDEPVITPLRRGVELVRLATALSSDGQLAVLTESRLGELEAAVFDPKNPGEPVWRALTTKDDAGRFPQVVFHDGKFFAAWTGGERTELRARTFTAERAGPSAAIAPLHLRGRRMLSIAIVPDGEELLFAWHEDQATVRRVPVDFAGLWFAEHLCKWLFGGTSVAF